MGLASGAGRAPVRGEASGGWAAVVLLVINIHDINSSNSCLSSNHNFNTNSSMPARGEASGPSEGEASGPSEGERAACIALKKLLIILVYVFLIISC